MLTIYVHVFKQKGQLYELDHGPIRMYNIIMRWIYFVIKQIFDFCEQRMNRSVVDKLGKLLSSLRVTPTNGKPKNIQGYQY